MMNLRVILIGLGVALLVIVGQHVYWAGKLRNVEGEFSSAKLQWATATAKAEEKARLQLEESQRQIAYIDEQRLKEVNDAKADTQRRIDAALAGRERVYIRATCPKPSGVPASPTDSGVDDGKAGAELDPEVAAELYRIAGEGDAAIRQLTALQEVVRALPNTQEPSNR